MSSDTSIQPPATIGVVGGGQLGRMMVLEARRMGFRTVVFTDEAPGCPGGQVADEEINATFDDAEAKEDFLSKIDVCTYEFENIPADFIASIEAELPVHPSKFALETCQHREREKLFLRGHDIPCAPFAVVDSAESLADALEQIGTPCVLKTAAFGYDGKGQIKISEAPVDAAAVEKIWSDLDAPRGVLEGWVNFVAEVSVVAARGIGGSFAPFPVSENIHTNHILDTTIVPARISDESAASAVALAKSVGDALGYVGVFAVELFLLEDGSLVVNEIAPRPHNSGHYTIDACDVSQFGMQIRAVAGLPLSAPRLLRPVAMVNLLGDVWPEAEVHPDWSPVLDDQDARLHLYGKRIARAGRKMGHFCVLADDAETAYMKSQEIMGELKR
ncbi:5-(carboxyamino)imidazole ribonucleotide synthase [Sulfuriroseicoccus oceanibius]|uniref:N5-carboxyaminoimidazole ribonucleotide synthase n=1 Tax=Sulfuriroseicoccus oceanibius TaxID=2707525 RepID=A0A6B3L2J3_9BACT|nr:5-(carboxyamino)imidazole ribonucleotide synthase [Sulfuriroseicoccus oceanibius]QQL46065.1 5-(carboxyamino)imidazole ribonucleotide synthase [Sulfuriroseicoccus oceanibius]